MKLLTKELEICAEREAGMKENIAQLNCRNEETKTKLQQVEWNLLDNSAVKNQRILELEEKVRVIIHKT